MLLTVFVPYTSSPPEKGIDWMLPIRNFAIPTEMHNHSLFLYFCFSLLETNN